MMTHQRQVVVRETCARARVTARSSAWKHVSTPLAREVGKEIKPISDQYVPVKNIRNVFLICLHFHSQEKHHPCIHPDKTRTTGASEETQKREDGLHRC